MREEKLPFDPNTELRSDMWDKLTLNELWLQKILLQQRIDFCNSIKKYELKQQMERGMKFLQVRIDEQNKKEKPDNSIFI